MFLFLQLFAYFSVNMWRPGSYKLMWTLIILSVTKFNPIEGNDKVINERLFVFVF